MKARQRAFRSREVHEADVIKRMPNCDIDALPRAANIADVLEVAVAVR